jgi:hypothetical protein
MHTVELLEQAIGLAGRCGIVVRQDWFGGLAAGACEFQGRRWIFIDLALSPREQLEQVLDGLKALPSLAEDNVPPQLHSMLSLRNAA